MARLSVRAALACALLAAAPATPAASAWSCALSGDLVRLVCDADAPTAEPAAAVATVHGTAFPLDPRRRWVVDLWSPPTEPEMVERLARATICYRSPGCSVSVDLRVLTAQTAR